MGIKHIKSSRLFKALEVSIELTRKEQTHLAICDDCRKTFAGFGSYIALEAASGHGRQKAIEYLVERKRPHIHITHSADATEKAPLMHISDERFRDVALSAIMELPGMQTVLSAEESAHFRNCPECIDRLGDITRQLLQRKK